MILPRWVGFVEDPRYLHQGGHPAVQIWGFYFGNEHNPMNAELANRLIDFFRTPGRYSAFLVGGGDWTGDAIPIPRGRSFTGDSAPTAPGILAIMSPTNPV